MKIEIYKDKHGKWRWRAVSRNGKIVADSGQGYATRAGALRSWDAFEWKIHSCNYTWIGES